MLDEKTQMLLNNIPSNTESLLQTIINNGTKTEELIIKLEESQKHCKILLNHIKDVRIQIKPTFKGIVISINPFDSITHLTKISSFNPLQGKEGLYSCVPITLNAEEIESLLMGDDFQGLGSINGAIFDTDLIREIPVTLEDVQYHSDSFKVREKVFAIFPGTSIFREGHIITVPGRRRRSIASSSFEFSIKFINDTFPSRTVHSSFILKCGE